MLPLSVVIPTYNRRTSLERCLDALRAQTLPRANFQIIVIDDGSTDGTNELMECAPDICFFRQPRNAGPAAARNVGIRAAQGDWLLFLGDDTFAAPDALQRHLDAHAQTPGAHIAALGNVEWWEGNPVTPLMRYLT